MERLVNETMAVDPGFAGKILRDDSHPKMTLAPGAMARMPDMGAGLVDDFEMRWRKGASQLFIDQRSQRGG